MLQVPAPTGLTPAQIFAQAGLQVQQAGTSAGGTPVATLVKTANMGGVRTATPQQIRQLALHPQIITQRKLPAQKVAQLAQVANKAGVQTQLIVQPTKSLPTTMTVQQIHQVMKHVQPSAMQQFTHVFKRIKDFFLSFANCFNRYVSTKLKKSFYKVISIRFLRHLL